MPQVNETNFPPLTPVAADGVVCIRDSDGKPYVKPMDDLSEFLSTEQYVAVPGTATSSGTTGQLAISTTYLYVCVATNTWVRTALATF